MVWSSVVGFVSRNKNRLAWVTGTVGSGYMLFKYAKLKWEESQARHEAEQAARSNIKRRFEQNLQDCSFVVASLLPTLSEHLFDELNVEHITAKLQQSRAQSRQASSLSMGSDPSASPANAAAASDSSATDQKTRMELWEDVKLMSFTRTLSALYLVNLLTVFTTIQLNILGRFFYLDSVAAFRQQQQEHMARDHSSKDVGIAGGLFDGVLGSAVAAEGSVSSDTPNAETRHVSEDTERRYLTFSWYLLNIGWEKCVARVQRSVEKAVSKVGLKQAVGYNDIVALVDEIRRDFEHDDEHKDMWHRMDGYLLPAEGEEHTVLREGGISVEDGSSKVEYLLDRDLKHLLDETRDFMEGPDFEVVLKACLDESFDLFLAQLKPNFVMSDSTVARVRPGRLMFEAGMTQSTATSPASPTAATAEHAKTGEADGGHGDERPESPVPNKTLPFAGVLPIVSRTVHHIVNGVPNLFLDIVTSNPKLKTLAVVVYTGWE
ncbi:Peroxin-3 [Entophlyctis helioformis]|nr:Peroxin-3 [Entophlyctis helioformis]